MTARRTNQGQQIDIDALALKNEKEIALGNMKVNARGDKIGKGGKIVAERDQVARAYYENNPKAVVQSVSIKDAVDDKPVVEQSASIVKPKKTKVKKTKEVELPNGDIEIQEIEEEWEAPEVLEEEEIDFTAVLASVDDDYWEDEQWEELLGMG